MLQLLPATTQVHTFIWKTKIFSVLEVNSLCKIIISIDFGIFPVFSLSGKNADQILFSPRRSNPDKSIINYIRGTWIINLPLE